MIHSRKNEIHSNELPIDISNFISSINIQNSSTTKIEYKDTICFRPTSNIHNEIQKTIEKKNAKLPSYQKKKLDEYWLLIQINSANHSSPFDLDKNILENFWFSTNFNKIFIISVFGEILLLNTKISSL